MNKSTMNNEKNILDEALNSLLRYTQIQGGIKNSRTRIDAVLQIANVDFAIEIKPVITKGNKGIILAQLKEISRDNNLPILLITKYIPGEIAKEYIEEGINCLDVAGNCHIRHDNLYLIIEGKKTEKNVKIKQSRAFRESGIKLIFQFLVDPEKTQLPYRDLAELANISLGSVGAIMNELIDLNFILQTKQTKKLKNTKDLLNRWITAYHDVLRPRLMKKKMRFINQDNYNRWKDINLNQLNGHIYWGGETGANLLTGYLHPGTYTIYTDQNWHIFKDIELIPDENGKVEILDIFWDLNTIRNIPPLLIYADLMSSGSDRNTETANMILNNELQYIK